MAKRVIRVQKPKQRREWKIDPTTRVCEDDTVYHRARERERSREMLDEEIAPAEERGGGRILGIDYGERRVGLAVSDPLGIIAQGMETFRRENDEGVLTHLKDLIAEYDIQIIVIGLPLHMDGRESEMAKQVQQFAGQLTARFQIPVTLWDERMTTAAARRTMHEMGKKAKGAKEKVDRIAAMLILQSYLDAGERKQENL